MAKKLLFVINTMGRGGAEAALLELLRVLSERDLELNVRIMLSQGELAERLPEGVRLLIGRKQTIHIRRNRHDFTQAL